MVRATLLCSLVFAGAMAASAAVAEPVLEIQDAALRVTVIPEARADIQVSIASTNARLPITVTRRGDHVIVRGRARGLATSCWNRGGRTGVNVAWFVPVADDALPQIIVRAPLDVVMEVNHGAAIGTIGTARSLRLGNSSCGSWRVGNISGRLAVMNAGSATILAGDAGSADVSLAGSGDMSLRQVVGPLAVRIRGSANLDGVSIGSAQIDISGSGDVHAGRVLSGLTTRTAGSGDITADAVDGVVAARIMGSGDVRVRGGRASTITATTMGSGDINFGGSATSLDATIMGSGDVHVGAVSGPVRKLIRGSGEVSVGS